MRTEDFLLLFKLGVICVAISDLVESGEVWFGNEDRKLKLTAVRWLIW